MRSPSFLVASFAAVSVAVLCAATPVLAADLGSLSAPPLQSADPMMEFGSSWYLRGDIGAVLETNPKISNDLNLISGTKRKASFSGDIGFGYKFNNWFRADTFVEQRTTQSRNGIGGQIACPTGVVLNPGGLTTSLTYSTCDVTGVSKIAHWNLLANAYADLGNWGGLTPYIGAGLGVSQSVTNGSTSYSLNPGGGAYNATLTDPLTLVTTTYNFNRIKASGGTTQLAWNVMAGVGYAISDHTTIDVGYRYLNMGHFTGVADSTGAIIKKQLTSHEVRMGVRYMID